MVGLWAFDETVLYSIQIPVIFSWFECLLDTIKQSSRCSSGSTADSSDTVVILMNDIGICMSDRYKRNARSVFTLSQFLVIYSLAFPQSSGTVSKSTVLFITTDQAIWTFVWCNLIGLVTATTQHDVNGCHSLLKVNTCVGWTVCNMMGEDVQVINSNEKLLSQYISYSVFMLKVEIVYMKTIWE